MNLTNEFEPIRQWASDKGIYEKGDIKTQTLKLAEEIGELSKAVLEKNPEEIWDAIGDMVVVLTSVAHFSNMSIEMCINKAFLVIAHRKGKMDNGTFIKDK